MGTCWPTWIRASRLSETRICGAARSFAFDLVAMAEIIARTSPLGSMPVKVNPALFAVVAVARLERFSPKVVLSTLAKLPFSDQASPRLTLSVRETWAITPSIRTCRGTTSILSIVCLIFAKSSAVATMMTALRMSSE